MKDAGVDDIRLHIMIEIIFQIARPLILLINQSLKHGIVPDEIKIANVHPMFKGGSSSDFVN